MSTQHNMIFDCIKYGECERLNGSVKFSISACMADERINETTSTAVPGLRTLQWSRRTVNQ